MLATTETGLSQTEVNERTARFGKNILPTPPTPGILRLFVRQCTSPLLLVLLLCAVLIAMIHGIVDSLTIGIILIINAAIGTYQEYHSQNVLQGLQKFSMTVAHVIREGKEIEIPDAQLVVGDVCVVREGEKVPGDGRLIHAESLRADESSLTGESVPVDKTVEVLAATTQIADQSNMLRKGTTIALGAGTLVITAIGTKTVIGGIAVEISTLDTDVPLARKIRRLSRGIIIVVLIAVTLFFGISLLRQIDPATALITAISLAVALIPEGLPVILTLVLAASVARMSRKQVLVKRLQAVEALGSATVIAVDKTGTITRNELCVTHIILADGTEYEISGDGFSQTGEFTHAGKKIADHSHPTLEHLLSMVQNATTAYILKTQDSLVPVGDPTELANLIAAKKYQRPLPHYTRRSSIPFDYRSKYSSHEFVDHSGAVWTAHIGAAEVIANAATLTSAKKSQILADISRLQASGLRVIGVSTKKKSGTDYEYLGCIGMEDSLKPDVATAIAKARHAGVHVVMITGDHALTAHAIASQAGIATSESRIVTGEEIDRAGNSFSIDPKTAVFARVNPEHKLQIINAFRKSGAVIAMTGDGVNDAASLVAADVGIAMGIRGTQVAQDAADIVLLDDRFQSITTAIAEGRALYHTIKKVLVYVLSSSSSEALTLFGALLLGLPSPISATQIIWLNFVTDGFLDVALSFEPHQKNILEKKWSNRDTDLVDRQMLTRVGMSSATMAIGTVFICAQFASLGPAVASSMALTTLAAFQWFHAWNCRSRTRSLATLSLTANRPLLAATLLVIGLQFLALYTPLFQRILHTQPLTLVQWCVCIGIATSVIMVDEARKLWMHARQDIA